MLYIAGIGLTVGCAGFVLYEVVRNEAWRLDSKLLYSLGRWVLVASLIYGAASFSLGAAWWRLLRWNGEKVKVARVCHGIYGRSQLAKYLPGNIFSLVGRQVLGRQAGFSHMGLATASILEIAGQFVAAGAIMIVGGQFAWFPTASYRLPMLSFGIAGAAVLAVMALFFVRKVLAREERLLKKHTIGDFIQLGLIFCLYVPFFLVGGTALWAIVTLLAGDHTAGWAYVLSVGTAAWILGFVVPGAPGGVGVRDALLIAGLTPVVGGPVATAATIAYRVVTTAGDILYFLVSCALPIHKAEPPKGSAP